MSCIPGMPCYSSQRDELIIYKSYPRGCGCEAIPDNLLSTYVEYSGPSLPNTTIANADNLTVALQKIDAKLTPEALFEAVVSAIQSDPLLKTAFCNLIATCP